MTSTEASRPIRDGDEWEREKKKNETSKQAPTRKTKAAVDRRQNNKMLLRQCPSAPRKCCPNCYAKQSQKDNDRSFAVGKQINK